MRFKCRMVNIRAILRLETKTKQTDYSWVDCCLGTETCIWSDLTENRVNKRSGDSSSSSHIKRLVTRNQPCSEGKRYSNVYEVKGFLKLDAWIFAHKFSSLLVYPHYMFGISYINQQLSWNIKKKQKRDHYGFVNLLVVDQSRLNEMCLIFIHTPWCHHTNQWYERRQVELSYLSTA